MVETTSLKFGIAVLNGIAQNVDEKTMARLVRDPDQMSALIKGLTSELKKPFGEETRIKIKRQADVSELISYWVKDDADAMKDVVGCFPGYSVEEMLKQKSLEKMRLGYVEMTDSVDSDLVYDKLPAGAAFQDFGQLLLLLAADKIHENGVDLRLLMSGYPDNYFFVRDPEDEDEVVAVSYAYHQTGGYWSLNETQRFSYGTDDPPCGNRGRVYYVLP